MYKRLILKNKLSTILIMKIITTYFLFLVFIFRGQSNVVNNTSNDTIVVIITSKNKEIRGLLIREDYNSLSLEVANEIQTYQKQY